jgi:hypothetical protein
MAAWSPVLLGGVVTLLGCGLLVSIGTAQWLMLRRHVDHAGRWIVGRASRGPLVAASSWASPCRRGGPTTARPHVGVGVAGGLLMAATTSTITGSTLRWLLPDEASSHSRDMSA